MKSLRSIGVLSIGYVMFLIYFVIGIAIAILTVIGINIPAVAQSMGSEIMMLGYWTLLFFPLVYGAGGFIMGVFIGFLYNQVAKKTGGILMDIVDAPKKKG